MNSLCETVMTRLLTVLVESDTSIRLFGECTKEFKDAYLGTRNGWSWQGGRFKGRPPHWVWGVKRDIPGGLDATLSLVGELFRNGHIDRVEMDYSQCRGTVCKRPLDADVSYGKKIKSS